MALDNFTVTRNPFNNALLTDLNAIYIDADRGNDDNPGTRALPKKSLAAVTAGGIKVLRGVFNENISISIPGNTNTYLIGDLNTFISGTMSIHNGSVPASADQSFNIENLDLYSLTSDFNGLASLKLQCSNCKIANYFFSKGSAAGFTSASFVSCLLLAGNPMTIPTDPDSMNNTIENLMLSPGYTSTTLNGIIVTNSISFTSTTSTGTTTLLYSIIRKSVVWKVGSTVVPIVWTSPGNEIQDVKDSLIAYITGSSLATANKAVLTDNVNNFFGTGTIIYDDTDPNVRIFNNYDSSGNVTDYSLNLQEGNPALTNSFMESYVGAYRPKINIVLGAPKEIDDNGVETGNSGDLLSISGNEISIDTGSTQTRNKMETGVITMPSGDRFTQFQSALFPSNSDVLYLRPKQDLTGGLSPINAVVIQPYDTPSTPSAYPKFCAPINTEVQIAYHLAGAKIGQPALFNDLVGLGIATNKNLAEVGTWAVTNAVDEWDGLITLPEITSRGTSFRYFKVILIGNRIE